MESDDEVIPARSRGLAPLEASDWLALQRRFCLCPERVNPALRSGAAPAGILRTADAGSAAAAATSRAESGDPLREARRLAALGVRVVPFGDDAYPGVLARLEDAPLVLVVRGQVEALAGSAIAIVGARAATRLARDQARRLGYELASQGFAVVSGLARGIDAEAHRGALEAGGKTLAVLACGIDQVYPPEHRALAETICQTGAVLSEMPLGTSPRREYFPLRNRIISGLALGVIVVEARERSGSLITVRHALAQGREVFALPGAIEGPFAAGNHRLLRDGARLIRGAADVVEDLRPIGVAAGANPTVHTRRDPLDLPSDPLEARIVARLAMGPATREAMIAQVELDPGRLARALFELAWAGRIVAERDGRYHLCGRPLGGGSGGTP